MIQKFYIGLDPKTGEVVVHEAQTCKVSHHEFGIGDK